MSQQLDPIVKVGDIFVQASAIVTKYAPASAVLAKAPGAAA